MAGDRLDFLRSLVASGGPEEADYQRLMAVYGWFHQVGFGEIVRRELASTLTTETMQGFVYLRPHGYSGDYEIIDRIYTFWHSANPNLKRWDGYFHAQAGSRAVRNRKAYFAELVKRLSSSKGTAHVLDIASGPGRDVQEFLDAHPNADVQIDGIDTDANAVEYATALCKDPGNRAKFKKGNALKFTPTKRYDLIWSAGLLDYFSDKTFELFLRRYYRALAPGGSLVVGNFGPANTSRASMEIVCNWHLLHRSHGTLVAIAQAAGIPPEKIRVDEEPEGVNLFLSVQA